MPILFGKKELDDNVTLQLFSFFDSKTQAVNVALINKSWHKRIQKEDLKPMRELAKSRLLIAQKIFRHCPQFQNETADSVSLQILNGGWTNKTFLMQHKENQYVVRLPGIKSETLIDRKSENVNARIASNAGINPAIVFAGCEGTQISEFIRHPVTLVASDFYDLAHLKKFSTLLKKLHDSQHKFVNDIDIFARMREMENTLHKQKYRISEDYVYFAKKMQLFEKLFKQLSIPSVPCHMDTIFLNIIYSKEQPNKFYLIDWEYSGNADPMWDISYFAIAAELDIKTQQHLLEFYFNTKNIDPIHQSLFVLYKPLVHYWMALWTNIQLMNKNFSTNFEELKQYEKNSVTACRQKFDSQEFNDALRNLKQCIDSEKFSLQHVTYTS